MGPDNIKLKACSGRDGKGMECGLTVLALEGCRCLARVGLSTPCSGCQTHVLYSCILPQVMYLQCGYICCIALQQQAAQPSATLPDDIVGGKSNGFITYADDCCCLHASYCYKCNLRTVAHKVHAGEALTAPRTSAQPTASQLQCSDQNKGANMHMHAYAS